MKFLNFMEKRNDPFLLLMLADLAQTLSSKPLTDVTFAFHSVYKPHASIVTISHYWTRLNDEEKLGAMKSDVYLRAAGQTHFTDFNAAESYLRKISTFRISIFFHTIVYTS